MRPREGIDREGSGVREGEIIRFTFILTKKKGGEKGERRKRGKVRDGESQGGRPALYSLMVAPRG